MAAKQIKVKIDENEADFGKSNQAKRGQVEPARRAALGELGNRTVFRSIKDGQKDLKDITKCQMNLRNAKAKVDTYWKPTQSTTINIPDVAAAKKNNVTRTKIQSTTGTDANKAKPFKQSNSHEEPQIRREESNLTRRSLRALKAAIAKEIKQPPKVVTIKKHNCLEKSATVPKPGQNENVLMTNKSDDFIATNFKSDLKIVSVQSHSSKLLSLVDNIDAGDTENPILVSEYVNDIYAYLYNMEVELCINEDHLKFQKEVSSKMRAVLIDWINEVHIQFHLAPETFQMTVAIIDRYLQVIYSTPRQQLQLVGVTSLFVAAKYEELYPPPIADFVYITDDTYSKDQILQMEKKILKALGYNLARPLPIHFLRRFSKAAKAEEYHHEMAKYFLELASVEYSLASCKPSEIAATALYLSLQLLRSSNDNAEELWTPTLEFYSRYTPEKLQPLVKKLATIAKNAPNAKLKAVYQKYQSTKFQKISLRPEIYGPRMDLLINN